MSLHLADCTIYLILGVTMTIWVGSHFHRNGRGHMIDAFEKEGLGDSFNKLLQVGFFMLNLGLVALLVNLTFQDLNTPADVLTDVTAKVGLVMLLAGGLYFIDLAVIHKMRNSAMRRAVYHQWWANWRPGWSAPQPTETNA